METREIKYYTLLSDQTFTDGFTILAGTKVMLNHTDGDLYNVQFEDSNTKRIFWTPEKQLLLRSSKKEKWGKKQIDQYNIDLNEKWLEHEQRNSNKTRTRTPAKAAVARKRSDSKTKTTAGSGRKRGSDKPVTKVTKKATKAKRAKAKK